ncbi:MAG: histidine phosphatase family protein [Candidatus Heimdallarchaeaceae archaeon]
MKNTYIFLILALTTIDKSQPAEKWVISETGIEEICNVVSSGKFDDVDVIISSSEKKAIQTAFYLSERIEKEINLNPNLKELDRGQEVIKTQEDYETKVWRIFDNPSECSFGWETAEGALGRFKRGISQIENTYSHKKIFIVSHGIILTLFFGDILRLKKEELLPRWKKLKFCAWGTVINSKVDRDIVSD